MSLIVLIHPWLLNTCVSMLSVGWQELAAACNSKAASINHCNNNYAACNIKAASINLNNNYVQLVTSRQLQ